MLITPRVIWCGLFEQCLLTKCTVLVCVVQRCAVCVYVSTMCVSVSVSVCVCLCVKVCQYYLVIHVLVYIY